MAGLRLFFGIGLLLVSYAAGAVNLHEAVESALQEHPNILAAKANEMVSQYAILQAKGAYFPQIAISAANGRQVSDNPFVRESLFKEQVALARKESQLTFNQMLFDGFRARHQVQAEKYNLEAANYGLVTSEQTLISDVAEAYLNVLRARELIVLAKNNIDIHVKTLGTVNLLFRGGAGTTGEVELANTRLALARLNLNDANAKLARAEAHYLALTGTLPPEIMERPANLAPYLPKSVEEAVQISYVQNPALNRLRATEKSAAAQVGVAKAVFVPHFTLEVEASNDYNLDGEPGLAKDATAKISVNYPIFSGGSNWASVNQARARRLVAQENIEAARRAVVENVVRSWSDYQTDLDRKGRQKTYVDYSKNVVADFIEQYTLGRRALFNVLDSQNELYSARTGLTDAYYDSLIDTYHILVSMGVLSERML